MMNDGFILDRAGYLVARIAEIAGSDAPAVKKIEAAYLLAFLRKPRAAEVQLAETHLQRQQGILSGGERVGSTGLPKKQC